MGVKPVTYYTVECDRCGVDLLDGGEFGAYSDGGAVLDVVTGGDGLVVYAPGDTYVLCPDYSREYQTGLSDEDGDALYDEEPEAVEKLKLWIDKAGPMSGEEETGVGL